MTKCRSEQFPIDFRVKKLKVKVTIALISENGLCVIIVIHFHLSSCNSYTQTPHELRMCTSDFWIQRSRSQCMGYWKLSMLNNCYPFTSIIMKLHTQTPNESRMCPIDFGVQRSRSRFIDIWKWFILHNWYPFTFIILKLHTQTPHEFRMCRIDFGVGVKCQGHNAWVTENGLCRIIAIPLHLSSWNFTHRLPMSRGCSLSIPGSKG